MTGTWTTPSCPPFYARSTGISGRIDRWQDIEYHAPCLYVLHSRVAPAGTLPAPDGGRPGRFPHRDHLRHHAVRRRKAYEHFAVVSVAMCDWMLAHAARSRSARGRFMTRYEAELVVDRRHTAAVGVLVLTQRHRQDAPLPAWELGAHIDVVLGAGLERSIM
ncbi:hypothetical protein SVIOM342S_09821 [Streptomyces violaceorubidus]